MKRTIRLLIICLLLLFIPLSSFSRAETGLGLVPAEQTDTITSSCTLTLPEGLAEKAYRITDSLVETYLIMPGGGEFTAEFPEAAQGVYLEWYDLPEGYVFEQLDASGNVISTDEMQPYFNCYYPLNESTRKIRVAFDREVALSGVWIYAASAELPQTVQQWRSAPETADVMIISATAETLLSEFCTVIADYTIAHEIPTSIVIMADGTRTAESECLAWLWDIGVRTHPRFGGFQSDNNEIYKMTAAMWRKNTTSKFINAAVEACAPKVLVSHIDNESAPLGAAQFTAEYVRKAAEKYDVPKLYMASPAGSTVLPTDEPIIAAGGLSAADVAKRAYAICVSQHQFQSEVSPNASFALAETLVGEDAANNNFLENIDLSILSNYVDPTPTPEPTAEPTPKPTPKPTAAVQQTPEMQADGKQKFSLPLAALFRLIPILGGGIVLTILVLLFTYDAILKKYRKRRRRRRGKRVALWVGLAPLLVSLVVSGVICLLNLEKTEAPVPVGGGMPVQETPAPEEPQPAESPDSSAEAAETADDAAGDAAVEPELGTVAPAAAGAQSAGLVGGGEAEQYFRRADDPEEYILVDTENGHWEYRTDELSVLIDRHEAEGPVVYFVAHIRMRNLDTFRTAQYAAKRDGEGLGKPWIISRRNKAVLLITGDNLVHMDTEYKGILIRDGKVFQDDYSHATDTMAMYPDLSMRIFTRRTTTADELLQDGVRQAFSFGPTLIRDGSVCENLDVGRLKTINPRTGIGMVEPGHFVAIIVDGRQSDYSIGMLLSEFAQLFAAEGCRQAYNLDGGVSTCMVFMGEQLNHHGKRKKNNQADDTYQRRIPDALIWGYSEQVPAEDDPIYNTGELN